MDRSIATGTLPAEEQALRCKVAATVLREVPLRIQEPAGCALNLDQRMLHTATAHLCGVASEVEDLVGQLNQAALALVDATKAPTHQEFEQAYQDFYTIKEKLYGLVAP